MSIYYLLDKHNDDLLPRKITVLQNDDDFSVELEDQKHNFNIVPLESNHFSILRNELSQNATVFPHDDHLRVYISDQIFEIALVNQTHFQSKERKPKKKKEGVTEIKAPMPGKVVRILVQQGQEFKEGDGLITVEAMKMENEIKAPRNGKVREITVEPGQIVGAENTLMVIE